MAAPASSLSRAENHAQLHRSICKKRRPQPIKTGNPEYLPKAETSMLSEPREFFTDDRVYAVGDIHGRADLLRRVRELIKADCGSRCASATTVFLGDYVDRGPDTREVLTILADEPFPTETIFLKG